MHSYAVILNMYIVICACASCDIFRILFYSCFVEILTILDEKNILCLCLMEVGCYKLVEVISRYDSTSTSTSTN